MKTTCKTTFSYGTSRPDSIDIAWVQERTTARAK